MRCPECKSTIAKKDYDPAFEWYECSSCEGSFTRDEILKAEIEAQKSAPVKAAGKVRRTEIELDEVAEQNVSVPVKITQSASARDGRQGIPSKESVNVMADAIEEIYREFHAEIDRTNAKDKAIILYRAMVYQGSGTKVREHEFQLRQCKEHS